MKRPPLRIVVVFAILVPAHIITWLIWARPRLLNHTATAIVYNTSVYPLIQKYDRQPEYVFWSNLEASQFAFPLADTTIFTPHAPDSSWIGNIPDHLLKMDTTLLILVYVKSYNPYLSFVDYAAWFYGTDMVESHSQCFFWGFAFWIPLSPGPESTYTY
jgi:hypothetical protein